MGIQDDRMRRLERLKRFQLRLIRINGSLEAAKLDPRWNNIQLLIDTITERVASSLEPSDISTPLTAAEIIFINLLLNNLREL